MRVANKRWHVATPQDVYIGRPSVFGNPYRIEPGITRKEAIEAFRMELISEVRRHQAGEPSPIVEAIRALPEDAILVCWCDPQPCHGDVIIRAWRYLRAWEGFVACARRRAISGTTRPR